MISFYLIVSGEIPIPGGFQIGGYKNALILAITFGSLIFSNCFSGILCLILYFSHRIISCFSKSLSSYIDNLEEGDLFLFSSIYGKKGKSEKDEAVSPLG